jgi:hypothetical protein
LSVTRPGVIRLLICTVLAALATALAPAAAPAAVKRFAPTSVSGHVRTFDVSALKGRDVLGARLVARSRARRVATRVLEGRRVVRVRTPRSWGRVTRSKTRLLVRIRKASAARRKPRPSITTSPAPATTPAPGTAPTSEPGSTTVPAGQPAQTGTCTTEGAGSGVVPGACWRPYSDDSPFNKTIPSDAKVASNSDAIVQRLVGWGTPNHLTAGDADTEYDWWHPTYYPAATDPLFTLHCTAPWGRCAIEGAQVRIPDAARAAGGGDRHLTVVDASSGWEYDLYDVSDKPAGGGTLSFSWGGRTRIDGDGRDSGATASNFGNMAGIIRAPEMRAGDIDHALFMVVKCDSGSHVYPATKSGHSCADSGLPTADAPPMGTRFQLNMSDAQIDALDVPAYRKTILRAMARYGMYFGDTGSNSWGLAAESGSTYTSFGKTDGLVDFAKDAGVPSYNGKYVLNVRDGVDYAKYLRVVDPCTTQGTC